MNLENVQFPNASIIVITSLHENIEDEFQSLCLRIQVGNTLDAVEQLVEGQVEALQPFPWTWSEQSTSCTYQLYVHIVI
ncbi:hypothetical protein Pint_19514 [Pistacia integerrima]|uniref:Uncharacterized protein n=1 Tax=Pistacia integerrima TaxID=434235 RepID=A0ACC0Z1I6_9ROSI|nr:hypothetical protein Pint_19514 [Pistacia integerrima]